MADFQPIYKPTVKPVWSKPSGHGFLRSNFRMETFMVFGALGQSLLTLLLPLRVAFLPAAVFLLFKIADAYAIKTGLKANPHMEGALMTKFAAQLPDKQGAFGNQPARDGMAVLIIGARNNSALGLFDKSFAPVGKLMQRMIAQLEENATELGFMGSSSWTGNERAVNASIMNIMYFKSAAHVHNYAHGPLHREAWTWWYKNLNGIKEYSIYHELYEVPSGNYEAVYAQMPPMLAAATQHKVTMKTDEGIQEGWLTASVDATKGQLKTSRGRMARSSGQENDKYGHVDTYDYEEVEQAL